jgi:sugar lactone lactonase YvrE
MVSAMLTHARTRVPFVLLGALGVSLSGCSGDAGDDSANDSSPTVIELPGDTLYPEGIALDPTTGAFFVGSTDDGTILRGQLDGSSPVEVFAEPGEDGRTAVTGLALDGRGRLFVAGRDTGRVFVLDTASGETLAVFETAADGERALMNDIAVTPTAVFITDSFRAVLWRMTIAGDEIGAPEPWVSFEGTAAVYGEGFNMNGIVALPDGDALVAVHYGTGELFRIDTTSRAVERIDLNGSTVPNGDGMELAGDSLLVAHAEPRAEIVEIRLADDGRSGEVVRTIDARSSRFPTTFAVTDRELIVVGSQLNMSSGDSLPVLPFVLTRLPR